MKQSLKILIKRSYGEVDGLFVTGDIERKKALKSLIKADEDGISYDEFISLHKEYLDKVYSKHENKEDAIKEQLRKVNMLSFYLSEK